MAMTLRIGTTLVFFAVQVVACSADSSQNLRSRISATGSASTVNSESASLASASQDDRVVNLAFTLNIGSDGAWNKNCISIGVNGAKPTLIGCDRDAPGNNGQTGVVARLKPTFTVHTKSFNFLRITMTSQSEGGVTKHVFDSSDGKYVADLDYHINGRTDNSLDMWINDNGDFNYKDFHLLLKGPDGIKFGVDYLAGAACSENAAEKAASSYVYRSPSPVVGLPTGANGATFTFSGISGDIPGDGTTPLATLDVYVPDKGISIDYKHIFAKDLSGGDARDFLLTFVNSYPSVQFRVCSYGVVPLKVLGVSTKFNPDVPFAYLPDGQGVHPVDPNPDQSGVALLKVDLSHAPMKKQSLNGVMRGLTSAPQPKLADGVSVASVDEVAAMLKPLKAGLWRAFTSEHASKIENSYLQYAEGSGIPVVANVSLLWGGLDKLSGKWNKGSGPWVPANQPIWKGLVSDFIDQHWAKISYIDVWNEPEYSWSLKDTPNQLFQTYVTAAKAMSELPGNKTANLKIGGPSLNNYNREYIRAFLDFAKANGVQVNVLSWHELGSAQDNLPTIADHLRDAREQFFNKPEYAALKLQEIHINEAQGPEVVLFPGEALGTLHYLEVGGADRAAKDCWVDDYGDDRCNDGSVGGLFVPPNEHYDSSVWYQPRAAYWAYKNYADVLGQSVPCSSSNKNIVCFAGAPDPSTGEAKIVVGYYGTRYEFKDAAVTIELSGVGKDLAPNGRVHVKIEKIPTTGDDPLPRLPVLSNKDAKVVGGKLTISLLGLVIHEGAVIDLSAGK